MFQKVVFNGDSIATNIPVDHLVRKKLLLEKNHSFQRPLTAQVVESRTKTLSKYKDFVSVIKSYDHLLSCFRNFTSKIPEGLIELESMIQLMQFSHVYEKYIKQAQMRCSSVNCGPNFRSITKTSQIYKDGFKGMCEWAKFVAIFNDTIQKGHLPYKNGFETIFYKALFYVHRVKVLMETKGLDADFSYSEVLEILKKTKKLYNYTMKIFQKPISIRFNSFKFGRYSNRINKLQNMISKLYDNQLPKSLIAGVTEINRIRIPWTSSVTNIGLLMTAACNFKFDISLMAQAIYIFNRELNNIHRKLKLPFEVELEEGWISKSKSKSETTINSRTSTLGADHHNIDEFHYDEGDNDSVSSDIRKIRHVNEVIDEILVVIHSTGEDNSKAPEPTYISKPPLVDENAKTFTEDFGFKPESSDFHEDNAEESSDNKCKPIHEMCDKNELNVTELNIEEVSAGKSLTIDEFTKSKGGLNKDDINKTEMSIDEIDSKSDVGQSGISDLENECHTDEINALNVADTNINSLEDQKTNVAIVPTEENDVTNENEDSTFNRSAELDIKVEVSAIDENEDATSNKSARLDINVETAVRDEFEDNTSNKSAEIDINVETTLIDENEDVVSNKPAELDINVETILTDENEDATFNRSAELDIKVEASAIDENEDATSIKSAKLDIKLEASVIDEFGDTTSNKSAELDIKETTLKDENEDTTSNKPAELDIKETSLIDEIEDTTFNKSAELDIKETTLIDENEGATFNKSAEPDIKVEAPVIDEFEDTTSDKSVELDIELETTLIDEIEDTTSNKPAEFEIKAETTVIDEIEDDFVEDFDE